MATPILVPDVVGTPQSAAEAALKNAGLTVGSVKTINSTTAPAGNVTGASPAPGTTVPPNTSVNLEVSSGPAQIAVPDVGGLTRSAAEAQLKSAGLATGRVRTEHSDSIPAGGVFNTAPDAGALVAPGTAVELDVSAGPEPTWTQYVIPALFTALGIVVLALIAYIITPCGRGFLQTLSEDKSARGLITFLIAIATVGIAIILAISTLVLPEGDAGDKRFDRGKQVLTVLIGVLGTIVGFYFGSTDRTPAAKAPTITTKTLPPGTVDSRYLATLEATGVAPLKWSVKPDLPADLGWNPDKGTMDGTPKSPVSQKYTFTVMDSASPPATSQPVDLTLEIKPKTP